MKFCQTCGGATAGPNEVTGYFGPWCTCLEASVKGFGLGLGAIHELSKEEFRRVQAGTAVPGSGLLGPAITPYGANLQVGSMAPAEFVQWLRGYYAGAGALPKPIADMLEKVRT